MDKKLTDAEIVKALECCLQDGYPDCDSCPYDDDCNKNSKKALKDWFDLINRLQAENDFLKTELSNYEFLKKELEIDKKNLESENERLKEEKAKVHKVIPKMIKTAKAEAYKEFVNKIKVHAYYIDFPKEHRVVDEDDIDNLLKEMTKG